MARFLLRRLGLVVPALWLVSALIFALAEIVPGDVARTVLGPYATPDQVAALRHQLGADRPLVVRYAAWLGGFVTGNWGDSLVLHRPVRPFVFARLGNSFQLALVALVLVIPVSLALGVLAGLHEDRPLARNAPVPAIAVIGSQIGWLVGGLVVVETLFTYPGLGKLIYDSALAHDVPVLEATALLVAAIFMLSNLAADAMVALLQPRVRSAS